MRAGFHPTRSVGGLKVLRGLDQKSVLRFAKNDRPGSSSEASARRYDRSAMLRTPKTKRWPVGVRTPAVRSATTHSFLKSLIWGTPGVASGRRFVRHEYRVPASTQPRAWGSV